MEVGKQGLGKKHLGLGLERIGARATEGGRGIRQMDGSGCIRKEEMNRKRRTGKDWKARAGEDEGLAGGLGQEVLQKMMIGWRVTTEDGDWLEDEGKKSSRRWCWLEM